MDNLSDDEFVRGYPNTWKALWRGEKTLAARTDRVALTMDSVLLTDMPLNTWCWECRDSCVIQCSDASSVRGFTPVSLLFIAERDRPTFLQIYLLLLYEYLHCP